MWEHITITERELGTFLRQRDGTPVRLADVSTLKKGGKLPNGG
jgi:hypothetical protein